MVALGISEFTFGFAFLFEQTRRHWGNLLVAPILPSLWDENELGWDAHLPTNGTDFYYQFKLSEYLIRPYAKFRLDGTYINPYFRISLHKHDQNKQHKLLRELAITNPETYYVAPESDSSGEFNQAFLASSVTDHSRIIPVRDGKDINDGDQHYITYQRGDPGWIQHTEPTRMDKSVSGKDLAEFYRGTSNTWQPINEDYASTLFIRTRTLVEEITEAQRQLFEGPQEELLEYDPEGQPRALTLDRAAKILSVFFGVSLVIAGEAG